jgi:nucleoside-diphosphate-sugar epimerase
MKVLLTGANGFVGSHVLDALLRRGIPTAVLLRRPADLEFVKPQLPQTTVYWGSLSDTVALARALTGITHVVHAAGRTKALHDREFFEVNRDGTRQLVQALRLQGRQVQGVVHLSSLAAAHPAGSARPAAEDDPPAPITPYGRSKLAGEDEIRSGCPVPFVILRPPAVYGPRDRDFLQLFRAVRTRVIPVFRQGHQELSLAYVRDLAEVVVKCLDHPKTVGKTLNVAAGEIVTTRQLIREIARQMDVGVLTVPLPLACLWATCVGQELWSRIRRRPMILSRQKYAEVAAAGWVCRVERLRSELGQVCPTPLAEGIRQTLAWYRQAGWLPRSPQFRQGMR